MNTPFPSIVDRAREALRRHEMVAGCNRVLAAVSGGPDSVCMLHVLLELGVPVETAHFDHQTRAGESTEDARFVAEMCRRLGVPCHVGAAPIEEEARRSNLSFQDYARRARYRFLAGKARETACSAIATGHHGDDQAETVLMRLLRGASPEGVGGIPPVGCVEGVRVIRPLIDCTRAEILSWLDHRGIAYRLDRTNEEVYYLRNRVRKELLPLLTAHYNPNLRDALRRYAEIHRAESRYIEEAAQRFLARCLDECGRIARQAFAQEPIALQRRGILDWARRFGGNPSFEHVDEAVRFLVEGRAGAAFDLSDGLMIRLSRDRAEIAPLRARRAESGDAERVPIAVPGCTSAFGKTFAVRLLSERPTASLEDYCNPHRQVFDADALAGPLWVRLRKEGDTFVPLGMTGRQKLKKRLSELGLLPGERASQVLVLAQDEIIWVVGRAVGALGAVTDQTRRFLEIEVTDATDPQRQGSVRPNRTTEPEPPATL